MSVRPGRQFAPEPRAAATGPAWKAAEVLDSGDWLFPMDAAVARDTDSLLAWAEGRRDPLRDYETHPLRLAALEAFGAEVRRRLQKRLGFVYVQGVDPGLDDSSLRLIYLAIGLAIGPALGNYGSLYDVTDRGVDYRTAAVPVSMTREATTFHTDSSARDVEPDYVGLLCLQPAAVGGASLVASAAAVHDRMRRDSPELLERLYRDFPRDVVTPGTDRNLNTIRMNSFPIFSRDPASGELTLRYMRYWIERAADILESPLAAADIAAMDRLDSLFNSPEFAFSLNLRRGEMLWLNNRAITHNRQAYEELPGRPRLLVRMWTLDPTRTR